MVGMGNSHHVQVFGFILFVQSRRGGGSGDITIGHSPFIAHRSRLL